MTFRRLLIDSPVLNGVCIALGVVVVVFAATMHARPTTAAPVLEQFASTIDRQYHECVPLGWFPENGRWPGTFPGYNADVAAKGVVFEALWVGVVPARSLGEPHVAAVKAVLDELARLRLLKRSERPGEFRYNLTHEGERYYYERNNLGNNVEAWSYLCFSRLHARDVAWASRPSKGRGPYRHDVTARIRFTWEPQVDAPWATPFVKAHAVELNPTSSPAEATVFRRPDRRWGLSELDFSFPRLEDPSAWTTG
jgi:hypothetical protein